MEACEPYNIRTIFNAFTARMQEYLNEKLNTNFQIADKISGLSNLRLKDINSVIYGQGLLHGCFIFCVNDHIALTLLRDMIGDEELEPAEEAELKQDCISEALNIVIGNIMHIFDGDYKRYGFSTPTLFNDPQDIDLHSSEAVFGHKYASENNEYYIYYVC